MILVEKTNSMSLPNIPSGFNQLIILFCVGIFVYSYQEINSRTNKLNDYFDNQVLLSNDINNLSIYSTSDSADISFFVRETDEFLKKVSDSSHPIANKNNIDSIKSIFNVYRDSIIKKVNDLRGVTESMLLAGENLKMKRAYIEAETKSIKRDLNSKIWLLIPISILFIIALFGLYKNEIAANKLLEGELYKNQFYKRCQSCAKQFSPKLLHGTEKDESINSGFCEECYRYGSFTDPNPNLTVSDVVAEIKKHYPKDKNVDKKVNQMVRWNPNPYN